jgi:CBS domain-containing membrane protein
MDSKMIVDEKLTLTEEDLRDALKEVGTFVDITESDLKKIYEIAVRIAKERCAHSWLAREIMTRDVITVQKDTDVYEAGRLLIRHKISGMPVVDDENHVIGMITQADLLTMAGIPRGHVFNDVVIKYVMNKPVPHHRTGGKVKDIMTTPVITVSPETTAKRIATILDRKRIKRVPVVDDENRLLGIVSRGDIVRVVCEEPSIKRDT